MGRFQYMPLFEPVIHEYHTSVRRTEGCAGFLSADGLPRLEVGCPKEFGGDGGTWTPEHLLVGSLETCIMTTFSTFCKNMGVEIISYKSTASGKAPLMGKNFSFSEILVQSEVIIPQGALEKARRAMDQAAKLCMVTATLKCNVRVEADISEK
jgi:organic hydroperoxide reductase OsmC/OhrA